MKKDKTKKVIFKILKILFILSILYYIMYFGLFYQLNTV